MSNEAKTDEPSNVSRALVFLIDRLCLISVVSNDDGAVKAAIDGLDRALPMLPAAFHDIRVKSTEHYSTMLASASTETNDENNAIVDVK